MLKRFCFKELAHVMLGLASQKSVGQACKLEAQLGVSVAVLRQTLFLENFRFFS